MSETDDTEALARAILTAADRAGRTAEVRNGDRVARCPNQSRPEAEKREWARLYPHVDTQEARIEAATAVLAAHVRARVDAVDARLAAVEALGLFERWGVALPAADGFINPSQVEYASGREGAEHKAEVLNDVRPSSHPERFVPVRCWTSEWEPALHSDPSEHA